MDLLKKLLRASKGTWYLLAALLLFAAGRAGALGFTGRVTAEDGVTGLAGVSVELISPVNDSVLASVATNGSGYYSIAIAAGVYHVQASLAGYFPALRSSHTVTTGDIAVDFALQPSGELFRDDCSANNWTLTSKPSAGSFTSNGNVCDYFSDFPSNTAGNVYDWFDRTGMNIPYANNFVTLRHRVRILSGAPIQGSLLFFNSWNWAGVLNFASDVPWEELSYTLGSRTNNTNLTGFQFINDPSDLVAPPSQWHSYIDYLIIHSRDRGFVAGQVKNLSGQPLPNSRVQVRKGAAVVGEGLSDATGNYTLWVATDTGGYNVYFSTNGTAQFRQDGVAVLGRTQTTVNINIDTAPPAAVTTLGYAEIGVNSARLTWMAPGDDGWSGQLNASSFTIQYSTDPFQAWSPQLAQIYVSTWGVNPFTAQSFQVYGLRANATNYFRLWTRDAYGNFSGLSNGATVLTRIEQPQAVYLGEISSWTITASAYASTFTNIGVGLSAVNVATGTGYGAWPSGGNAWYPGTDMGSFRQGSAGAALGGKIYIMGGAPDVINYTAVVEEYDPVLNSWTTKNPMLTQRSGLAAAVLGGKIYAIGGRNSGGVKAANEEYDPVAGIWRTRAPMPTPRDRLAAAAMRGMIYAVGGADGTDTILDKNEVYDPAYDKWETRQPLPNPRRNQAAAATDERLYVSGGYNFGAFAELLRYDQWSNTWNQLTPMNMARYGHAMAAIGGKLYNVIGYNGTSYVAETEVFDLDGGFWASAAPMPAPREGAGAAVFRGNVYLAGGNDGTATYLKTAYRYDPGVSVTFKGLNPNRQYWFRAKARDQAGTETGETISVSTYTLAVATSPLPGQPAFTGVGYSSAAVHWSSGTQLSGFNDGGVRYEVQVSTSQNFDVPETKWYSSMDPDIVINDLRGKTTYYARVRAFNTGGYTDYSWTLLGSTRTTAEPLGGAIISTVTSQLLEMNPQRRMARDSRGDLYTAYYKLYGGKHRVFLARSTDNGGSWADTTAFPIETAGDYPSANSYSQGYGISLAIDSKDVLHLVWGGVNNQLDSSGGQESKCVYSSAPVPGTMWSPHVKIPAHSYQGGETGFTVAVDGNDGLHIVWNGQDCGASPDCYQLRYSSRAASDNVWKTWEPVNSDGKFYGAPALAIDAKNAAHIVVRHASTSGSFSTPQILYSSRSASGWAAWTAVYDSVFYQQDDPSLTIDAGGRLFAAWAGTDSGNTNPQIKYSILPAGGAWSPMQNVGTEPAAQQRWPTAAADAIGKVYVLWSGSDTVNSAINLKGSEFNGASWKTIDKLTDEETGQQLYPAMRWAGWRNNGGGVDVLWNTYDGAASTTVLRGMLGSDVPMSAGWTKTAWAKPAECGYTINVRKDGTGDFSVIQQAVGALPPDVSTPSCVVVRDTETYSEQVSVEGHRIRSWDSPDSRIFIMKDPTFVSSAPAVTAPLGAMAAFKLLTDSVTVQGINIVSTNSVSYGVFASSAYARVSSVTVSGTFASDAIYLNGFGLASYSTVTAVSNANGIRLGSGANTVSYVYSQVTNNLASPLFLDFSSTNTVDHCMFYHPNGNGVNLNWAHNNQISYSTVTIKGGFSAIYANSSDGNAINYSYLQANTSFYGLHLNNGSDYNTVLNSTMVASDASGKALYIFGSSGNTVTGSVMRNTAGAGVSVTGSNNNLISLSSVTAGNDTGLVFYNGSNFNTLSRSHVRVNLAKGVGIYSNSYDNKVEYSTIASQGWGATDAALYVGNSTQSVTSCYLQGSTAAFVSNAFVMMRDTVLVATNTAGIGLNVAGSPQGLFLASSTIKGGPQGSGAQLAGSINGKVEVSSAAVTGGRYGLNIATMGANGSLYLSSVTFQALSPGATAINFVNGYFVTDINDAQFASSSITVNVNAANLANGSLLLMKRPGGQRWGAGYETDPFSYVYWDTITPEMISPFDGAAGVPQAAALYVRAPGAGSAARYQYQLDTAPAMPAPAYSFDQTAQQLYPGMGAFSGQDGAVSYAGDSYLPASTATFVFFSTNTPLASNIQYYWRARVKTVQTGEYGAWTPIASFTTGERADMGQPNNLYVNGVNLFNPLPAGATIGFQLRENNVSAGTTPNGANYNTADWIFVKFSTQAGADGTWNHATITGGTSFGVGSLSIAADGKGAFLDHTSSTTLLNASLQLNWDYTADGVVGARAMVKVFAISMVKVPTGNFVYNAGGIGGGGTNNYGGGSQATVSAATQRPTGAAAGWPNGYDSFYIMRYELSQGQYADFLNTLHSSTAAVFYDGTINYGHNMSFNSGMPYGTRYAAEDRFAAKNLLSTNDLWAYLSWAALRPMTEMEYEKAGRDTAADARTYPWGETAPDASTYSPPNESGTHKRNFMNFDNIGGGYKVLNVGRYQSGDVYRTPEQTGVSPYGVSDLAGNVAEHVINCASIALPVNGNGSVLWPANWPDPGSNNKGLRGGSFAEDITPARLSERGTIWWNNVFRSLNVGGRGVRTP